MPYLAILGGAPLRQRGFPDWPVYDESEIKALIETLESGQWGIGSTAIEAFENHFARFCGADYAIACTNGTDAIYIAMQALGIGPGDEVILPPYTFFATAVGVLRAGAIPVMADIHPETYNLDPQAVEQAITPRTKAIIPVHIAGNPADMDAILSLAEKHALYVVEDAAQAHGAQWREQPVGPLGDIGTFSFQSSKNLAAGEGGALVTNHETLAQRIRTFVNCGRIEGGEWYDHHELAGNHRLGAFQAAVLNVGLQRIEHQMEARSSNASYLAGRIHDIEGMNLTATHKGCTRHAYHLCILRYNAEAFKNISKTKFAEALQHEGINCANGYLPLYHYCYFQNFPEKTPGFRELYQGKVDYTSLRCPIAERAAYEEGLWLFQEMLLGDHTDMDDIADAILKIQKHADDLAEAL